MPVEGAPVSRPLSASAAWVISWKSLSPFGNVGRFRVTSFFFFFVTLGLVSTVEAAAKQNDHARGQFG